MKTQARTLTVSAPKQSGMNIGQKVMAAMIILGAVTCMNFSAARAQYFQSRESTAKQQVMVADGLDSVLFASLTPFALPATPDSVQFTYHEPMPDSIMPRSAMVVGTVTVQSQDPDVLVTRMEKFARQSGADWIVSFAEPRLFHDKSGNRLYRSSAQLLRVLDPTLIQQTDLQYSYYEISKLRNYASVTKWFDSYGRQMGSKVDPVPSDSTDH